MIIVKEMPAFPPKSNPFHHDSFRMGSTLGENVTIMYEKHTTEKQPYLIIVNTETGERIRLTFDDQQHTLG